MLALQRQRLRVVQAEHEDVYRDIVRVAEEHRRDASGRTIPEGSVCRIVAGPRSAYGLVRGVSGMSRDPSEALVHIDERLRNTLGLKVGDVVDLGFRVDRFGELRWAWSSSDPAYRASARLAVLSVALGILGLVSGLAGLGVALVGR